MPAATERTVRNENEIIFNFLSYIHHHQTEYVLYVYTMQLETVKNITKNFIRGLHENCVSHSSICTKIISQASFQLPHSVVEMEWSGGSRVQSPFQTVIPGTVESEQVVTGVHC